MTSTLCALKRIEYVYLSSKINTDSNLFLMGEKMMENHILASDTDFMELNFHVKFRH